MDPSIPLELRDLADTQRGMLTTPQCNSAGMSRRSLREAVASGHLLHPGRGVYAVSGLVDTTSPDAWHRHLIAGALLLYPDAILAGVSTLVAHGIPVWGANLCQVEVRRDAQRTGGTAFVRVRPRRGKPAYNSPLGRSVALAEALALNAVDHGLTSGVVSADYALHHKHVTHDDLAAAVEHAARRPHGSRARSMLALADGRNESVGESRCALALRVAGLELDPQVVVRDPSGRTIGRVDFVVSGTNVIVEFDGKVKFADGDPEVLWAEKKREDALRACGYVVVRITWADLEAGRAVTKVRRALARAA